MAAILFSKMTLLITWKRDSPQGGVSHSRGKNKMGNQFPHGISDLLSQYDFVMSAVTPHINN